MSRRSDRRHLSVTLERNSITERLIAVLFEVLTNHKYGTNLVLGLIAVGPLMFLEADFRVLQATTADVIIV